MNDKQIIVNKIISDAENEASRIIKEAEEKAANTLADAEKWASDYTKENKASFSSMSQDIVDKGTIVANLEAKKIFLAKKKRIIDEVFAMASDELIKMDDKKYLALIEQMIAKHAEDNDVVVVAKNDKNRINQKWLDAVAKKYSKKLSISSQEGSFSGGIILSNPNCDKNLTFEVELETLRTEIEPEIAKMVFRSDK